MMIKPSIKNSRFLRYSIVNDKTCEERALYIFKTHDVALLSWLTEKKRWGSQEDIFLITLDRHVDLPHEFKALIQDMTLLKPLEDPIDQLRMLRGYFQELFNGEDVHFLLAALELDLIKDCLIISPEEKKEYRLIKLRNRFPHRNLFHEKSIQDAFKEEIVEEFYNSQVILDIDLDFFTKVREDGNIVINSRAFSEFLSNRTINYLLLEKARCITIALEETYCNTNQESHNCETIFNRIMGVFRQIGLVEHEITYAEVVDRLDASD